MGIFVMGDIHGAYKALVQCLERSGFNYETDTLIQLGDVTDRHPQVFECVEELLKIKNLVAIKGNHDDWFVQYINTGLHPGAWGQGGKETLSSYLQHTGRSREDNFLAPADIPGTHSAFFNNQLPYFVSRSNTCFIHAGFARYTPFYGQDPRLYCWDRELWQAAVAQETANRNNGTHEPFFIKTGFREIYIGHTPTTKYGTDKPMQAFHIHNIDTGAGHTGRLTIMNVATKEYWQSDRIRELYPVE